MREPYERAQRHGRREMHQVVPGAIACTKRAFAEEPHVRRQPSVAPVVGGGDPRGAEAGAPRRLRTVAPRHDAPGTRRLRGGPGACVDRDDVGRQRGPRSRATGGRRRWWRDERRPPDKHLERGRDPQRIRQLESMQRAAQGRTLAKFCIAEHRRDPDPAGAHLSHERERQLPFRLCLHASGDPGAEALRRREPRVGQIERRAQHPRACAGPQRHRHRGLAVGNLAQCAAVWRATPTEEAPCFGKLVPSRISTPSRSGIVARSCRHTTSAAGRVGNEMLEGLIRPWIADALQHGTHRLASTVAEQPEQIPSKRAALRDMSEADLERLEPVAQAVEPRRRVARQSQQHRATAYRTRRTSPRALSQFRSNPGRIRGSNKVVLV